MKLRKRVDEEGEKMSVVEQLRKIACDELVSYHAYLTASKNIHGENWMDVKQEFEDHAKEELEHYEAILQRLFQLGEPVHAVFKTIPECCSYYWDVDTENTKEAVSAALKAEQEAVNGYRNLLITIGESPVEEKDFVTQRLAKKHLETEQEHVQDMVHLLGEF